MLGFGLKLLGFFSNNWKWLLPLFAGIALVSGAYFFITDKIDDAREAGFKSGVEHQIDLQQKEVDKENERNRKFEKMLDKAISNFGRDVVEQTVERMAKETKVKDKVTTIIRNNPIYQECKVEPEVLEQRNNIRKLGPQSYPIRVELGE